MAMTSNGPSRPFAQPTYPSSPAPTTASSLNYSQYGSGSVAAYASPSRNASTSSGSVPYNTKPQPIAPQAVRRPSGGGSAAPGGLKPPGGSGERKMESREVARIHWRALRDFLREWLEKESPTARASAREKLTRLTKLQFQELSTDVYDELMRRIDVDNGSPDVPFLPVRDDFHPKRNQARQKLATLPKNRFKDLASDVFHELRRRYPDFDEQEAQETIYDDEPPPAPGPISNRPPYLQNPSSQSLNSLRDRDRQRENPTPPPMARLNSAASSHQRQGSRNISGGSSIGSGVMNRARPSRENTRDYFGEQNGAGGYNNNSSSSNNSQQPNPTATAATNDVVVPVKSRMKEEEIEVPYARESIIERPISTASSMQHSRTSSVGQDLQQQRNGARTPRGDRDPQEMLSPQTADDREYYDRMSFSSNVTNKSKALAMANGGGGGGWDEEREQKIRAEYEFRVAGLERKIGVLEAERDEAKRRESEEKERRGEWEEEVRGLKERAALHASSLRSVQHELDLARDAAETARRHAEQSSTQAQDEVDQWRERCDGLEDELRRLEVEKSALEAANGGGSSSEAVVELRNEIHSLVDELNSLSVRNDDLVSEREQDAQTVNEMEAKVQEYKRKYDAVRIELRNLKATSTMFISKPATDDHLPASPDGNIADVHVSSFQSAIDGMLAAARSSTPSGVLPAMKAIVEAITDIGEDVKTFEARPNLDVDASRLESLKHESTTRLNNLMQAARNHAMASGLSPVSLIDGAAGHLSANVVEIIKLLKIRRTDKRTADGHATRSRSSLSIKDMVDRTRNNGAGTPPVEQQQQQQQPKSASSTRSHPFAPAQEERLREPPNTMVRQLSAESARNGNGSGRNSPAEHQRLNGNSGVPPNIRINSYQSVTSIARSDSFDLERKASVTSDRAFPRATVDTDQSQQQPRRAPPLNVGGAGAKQYGRTSETSETSGSSAVAPATADAGRDAFGYARDDEETEDVFSNEGGNEQEWDDVKPYLETQSSALVNSIQNLLASIRTGGATPALNEHLSEVIAIASSIVAVSTNALPSSLRPEGAPLLRDLVTNTNKLSEAQEQAKGGQFDKAVRQVIASASFGVAKSLKALMKLGTE